MAQAGPLFASDAGTALAFIPISVAALTGMEEHKARLASGLLQTSQRLGLQRALWVLGAIALLAVPLIGPRGPISLLDGFEGRRQLIAYYFMWATGQPAAEQCEGCTLTSPLSFRRRRRLNKRSES